ncbi:phage terminase large subunit family protein [Rickettsia endosymbiont of Cardiosporidium cionae]|uniref:phage terminase large subunit family protein n=1 Tax=Rickettsia endosymbiont of Cardiosporidium cionae TaxID=2777155 RepID=UPI001892FC4D|nr:phage terminase large subunit family protein [Rickettsia endosymbiont of Cardiosporidium cionae]KAF8818069.1 hypothetical protein IHI24_000868 [Rickettsia endosymbiont of Cardiosporidium cionae]
MNRRKLTKKELVRLNKALAKGLKPEERLSVSEWAEKYRVLSQKSASEAGRWRNSRTPYLREIMDCLSTGSNVQKVVFMKGAQVGGTEAGNNWIGYVIHMAPGPMMSISPTVDMAKRSSKQRIDPLITESSAIRNLIKPAKSRDSANTILTKEFSGGVLVMAGANSAVGLRSMPARYLFMDEVDGYPGDVDGEGDPILLAERRGATFAARRKVFLVSTPTIKGLSRIYREFGDSDQRYFLVPCPFCDHFQRIDFNRFSWPEGKPTEVSMSCESCCEKIVENHKNYMLKNGKWVATNPGSNIAGFHLSSLYSPPGWFSWADAAIIFEQTKKHCDLKKSFVNTVLGEPFEEENDAPDWELLYAKREQYRIGTVPRGGLFLTAGADVQKDRIECEVVAWGRNKESWSIEYFIIQGDTARKETWEKLAKILYKEFKHESGVMLPIRVLAVDAGYATQDVYIWARTYSQAAWGASGSRAPTPRTVVALRGSDRSSSLILNATQVKMFPKAKSLKVWTASSTIGKLELYRWLALKWPTREEVENGESFPAGACHFPEYPEEYFKQITSERRVIKFIKGFPKPYWEKDPGRRNEALDCRVYARAAAAIYGLDRFAEKHFLEFQKEFPTKENRTTQFKVENKQKEIAIHKLSLLQKKPIISDNPYL